MHKPTPNSETGRRAEDRAADYLRAGGYEILQRNGRLPGGEIDLVCKDGAAIVIVEVKARATGAFGSALGAVGARKQQTLRRLAVDYLQFFAPDARARFDVVAVDGLVLHRNAF
ncbi:MAG: YraN family protein [Candidatus Meridianibacter frigidus]|nr:MAG: YraN family protein [Candidatus Eremiobacteraeota bacterium]